MGMTFHALASGSAGNANLVDVAGFGILLDFGLKPRPLAQRLRAVGAAWSNIHAALLTHTHGDHWQSLTINELCDRGIPLHCHADHARVLGRSCPAFVAMQAAGRVHFFDTAAAWPLGPGTCRAFPLRHDGGVTVGFRLSGDAGMFGTWSLAYASDLGSWDDALVPHLCDVDVLALEFNHDIALQRQSNRPPFLIRRVLGDDGHLSNVQAADLVAQVVQRSEPGRLQHLVQLHLSRDCNEAGLAQASAQTVRDAAGARFRIHTATQETAGPSLRFEQRRPPRPSAARKKPQRRYLQLLLPGWEESSQSA